MKRVPKHAARKRRTRKQKLRAQARLLKYIERRLLTEALDVSTVFGRTGSVSVYTGDFTCSVYTGQSSSETPYASYARAILQRTKAAESVMLLGHSYLHGN